MAAPSATGSQPVAGAGLASGTAEPAEAVQAARAASAASRCASAVARASSAWVTADRAAALWAAVGPSSACWAVRSEAWAWASVARARVMSALVGLRSSERLATAVSYWALAARYASSALEGEPPAASPVVSSQLLIV